MVCYVPHIYIYLRVILGLYWDSGKENGNYYIILGLGFKEVPLKGT